VCDMGDGSTFGRRERRRRRGRRGRPGPFGWDFGPRGPRGSFFRSGEVRLALLSLLADEPGHGYDLMRRLEERSGGLYRASAGTVYPVLQQLEDEGLAESAKDAGKRVYQITDQGRAVVEGDRERIDRIWRRADRWKQWEGGGRPEGVEIGLTMGRIAKTAFRIVGRDPGQADAVRRVLSRTLRELKDLGR
jgi:DNA-binding PadR family transcriptional regulator